MVKIQRKQSVKVDHGGRLKSNFDLTPLAHAEPFSLGSYKTNTVFYRLKFYFSLER